MDAELTDLKPGAKPTVMELVEAAGVDVSDWANFKGGADRANRNPRYCYEWAFIDPAGVVVLNLWHQNFRRVGDDIETEVNPRSLAVELKLVGKHVQAARALRMDNALRHCSDVQPDVRVIVNDGGMQRIAEADAPASRVERRLLDPLPWTLIGYDPRSGLARLQRGRAETYLDQFDVDGRALEVEVRRVTGKTERLTRSPEVRRRVLARAAGKCELCGRPGFRTKAGGRYLETHHVVPLSDGGSDSTANVVALCPQDHREAHHGLRAIELATRLARLLEPMVSVAGSAEEVGARSPSPAAGNGGR